MRYMWVILCFVAIGNGRDRGPEQPLNITSHTRESSIFSNEYLMELGNHDATLHAINQRLSGMDEKLGAIQVTLDRDVMPTIHIFDFIKWLLALVIAAVIGAWVNSLKRSKTHSTA